MDDDFQKKSALENEALDGNIFDKKNNIMSLRSGLKYIIPKGIEMNLKEKMLNDSYTQLVLETLENVLFVSYKHFM